MNIQVTKNDLINMLKGLSPSYDYISFLQTLKLGTLQGGFDEKWCWNFSELNKLTNQELYQLYRKLT